MCYVVGDYQHFRRSYDLLLQGASWREHVPALSNRPLCITYVRCSICKKYRSSQCMTLVTVALVYCRCMECRLCVGWVAARSTYFPRRLGRWSASWDHQSPWHSYKGADPRDESQLHRVQIPTDKIPSLAKGMEGMALENIIEKRKIIMKGYNRLYRTWTVYDG